MDPAFSARVEPAGLQFAAPAASTLLNAALQAGIRLPNSCRNGTCRTCLCLLRSGSIEYLVEWPGLSAEEKQEGFILPCVALPLTDVVIDAPGATLLR
ncbi:MAG: 2Fe-2S iron-sulfur cluster-binding protein [Bacteroidia bacterium]|jgi:ferredoxin